MNGRHRLTVQEQCLVFVNAGDEVAKYTIPYSRKIWWIFKNNSSSQNQPIKYKPNLLHFKFNSQSFFHLTFLLYGKHTLTDIHKYTPCTLLALTLGALHTVHCTKKVTKLSQGLTQKAIWHEALKEILMASKIGFANIRRPLYALHHKVNETWIAISHQSQIFENLMREESGYLLLHFSNAVKSITHFWWALWWLPIKCSNGML